MGRRIDRKSTPNKVPTRVKPCCVLEQGTFTPQKVLVIPRKRWLRPSMTEKLFTGTLRINQPTNQLNKVVHIDFSDNQVIYLFMSPPCKGRETSCFSPCVRLSVCLYVCLSVAKSCPIYNLITVTDISTKLHTIVKHIETRCHTQEP